MGDLQGFFDVDSHTRFRHRNIQLLHHSVELVAVFCHINNCRRSTKDMSAPFFQLCGNIQRSLAAELDDDAQRLLLIIDGHNVFYSKRLKVKFVRSIIVCRYRLRIAVYHNGLKSQFP